MKNIISNTGRVFLRNKSFLYLITGMPVLLFLLMSVLLPYTEMHSITVINNTDDLAVEQALLAMEGIDIQEVNEDSIMEALIQGVIELAVVINSDSETDVPAVQIISAGESEIYHAVALAAGSASDTSTGSIITVNETNRGRYNLGNTSAFMIYKFIEGGSILGAMIIIERKKRVKDRIMMSGIGAVTYIGGTTLTYLLFTFIGTFLYYLTARILNFDFGMRNPLHYLLLICLANVFAAAFYVFSASFIKREEVLGAVTSFVIMPMAFFAGMFFPFKYMPEIFQKIAAFFPQRWIAEGIEQIQQTGRLSAALWNILLLIGLSAVLFMVGTFRNSRKLANQ